MNVLVNLLTYNFHFISRYTIDPLNGYFSKIEDSSLRISRLIDEAKEF